MTYSPHTRSWIRAILLALVLVVPGTVWADGDDFFAFQSRTFNPDGSRNIAKNGFLGNVRDEDGNLLHDATLTVSVKIETEDGPKAVTYNSYTNVMGRYRTLDAASVVSDLLGIDTTIKPGDVQLLGVEKKGYVQMKRLNRSRTGQTGVLEVDFIMKKTG
jgi:hypothetical protein